MRKVYRALYVCAQARQCTRQGHRPRHIGNDNKIYSAYLAAESQAGVCQRCTLQRRCLCACRGREMHLLHSLQLWASLSDLISSNNPRPNNPRPNCGSTDRDGTPQLGLPSRAGSDPTCEAVEGIRSQFEGLLPGVQDGPLSSCICRDFLERCSRRRARVHERCKDRWQDSLADL